jgi:Fuc2NAc and GlcNAc transferase
MIYLVPVLVATSFVLTAATRKRAIINNHLDIPNERSSHSLPTPRGAGIAIVATFFVGLLILLVNDTISSRDFFTLAAPGLIVALIGRLDDLGRVTSAELRLVGHFICASIAVWLATGLPALPLTESIIDFGVAGDIAAVIYLVWMLNLFNFMDGIDLITGIQTFTTCLGAAILLVVSTDSDLWLLVAVMAAAIFGFMYFNLPPAKIFLGDVGSGFIGFTIGAISLVVGKNEPLVAWAMIILLGVFVTDATVTLLRRLLTREHVYVAHRTHAYQHLSKKLNHHLPVSVGVGAINLFFLLPIAWLVSESVIIPIFGLLISYVPLVIVAVLLKAGKKIN